MMRQFLTATAISLAAAASACAQTPSMPNFPASLTPDGVAAADDWLALEAVDGAEAMAFVTRSNEKALSVLEGDPRYEPFRLQAEVILTATDRIPAPSFLGDGIGNFWQDAANPKGVWRRTTLDSYASADTRWQVLLDIDALARAEGQDWVFKGASCLPPAETRCLVSLSDGGKDAVVVREFDLTTKTFLDDGFLIPEGKHRLSWLDADTILIATDFGPENGQATLTESGYPFIVKTLTRGQSLDQAQEVYRGAASDGGYGVSPMVFRDGAGAVQAVLIRRPLDTFRSQTWELVDGRAVQLALPERVNVFGVQHGVLIFSNDQPWTRHGIEYRTGSLLSVCVACLRVDGTTVSNQVTLVFAPTDRQSIGSVAVHDGHVVVAYNDNVVGRVAVFQNRGEWGWPRTDVAVPDNLAVSLGASSRGSGRLFLSTQGFLTPPTLSLFTLETASLSTLKSAAPKFDAATHVVEQFEATSADGVKIPYFVVRPREMTGPAPAILFGYGGFQISFPPAYRPEMGKLWLENGGVFVQANIRGGGEFGPAWHQAALKGDRQRSFDDFAAVAEDLIARGITEPRRLGIYGRSNGGVLTSVSVTQRPDLFNAVVIESPLVDMMRYHLLPAGASWIGEYGDPRIPEEAAWIADYSAYQRLSPDVRYPRVYLTTNTRDDRVHPAHARKFAARMEAQGHDVLYFEDTAGGHSNDADPVANARRWARHYVYLAQQLMD